MNGNTIRLGAVEPGKIFNISAPISSASKNSTAKIDFIFNDIHKPQ